MLKESAIAKLGREIIVGNIPYLSFGKRNGIQIFVILSLAH